jgi:hypothetical protein
VWCGRSSRRQTQGQSTPTATQSKQNRSLTVWRFALKIAASSTHWSPFFPPTSFTPSTFVFFPSPQIEDKTPRNCRLTLAPSFLSSSFLLFFSPPGPEPSQSPGQPPRARPSCPPFPTYTAHASFFLRFPSNSPTTHPASVTDSGRPTSRTGTAASFGSLQLLHLASLRDQFVSLSCSVADRPNRNHFFPAQQIGIETYKVSRIR